MTLGDILLCLGAAGFLIFCLYLRSARIKAYNDRQKAALRNEQQRAAGSAGTQKAKTGVSFQALQISGFHPDLHLVFEDKDKKAPVHVEFAVDHKGQQVAFAVAEDAFETRTLLQVNGCEIKENREYSLMVNEIDIGMKGGSSYDADRPWMEGARVKIDSLSVILYTGRLVDPPTSLELFGCPRYVDYEKYEEAKRFAVAVQSAVNEIIAQRVK